MSNEIDDALDLTPQLPAERTVVKIDDGDLDYARGNLLDAAEKGREALDDMIAIAQQSQHPRAYEVVNSLIKTIADVSGALAELKMKRQKLDPASDPNQKTINNNLFVGSTADLQRILSDMRNDG
jgi:hypothetical protein